MASDKPYDAETKMSMGGGKVLINLTQVQAFAK
jgi:hypothetical protein